MHGLAYVEHLQGSRRLALPTCLANLFGKSKSGYRTHAPRLDTRRAGPDAVQPAKLDWKKDLPHSIAPPFPLILPGEPQPCLNPSRSHTPHQPEPFRRASECIRVQRSLPINASMLVAYSEPHPPRPPFREICQGSPLRRLHRPLLASRRPRSSASASISPSCPQITLHDVQRL